MGVLLFVAALLGAPAPAIPWERDHGAAYAAAEERRAPLLVHFRSDHCARSAPGGGGVAGTAVGRGGGAMVAELPRAGGGAGRTTRDAASDCDQMEELVWSREDVVAAAARFAPVITGDTADRTLIRRYEVATVPTTLLADPWGNEIVRLVHYVEPARLLRVLSALPADFRDLQPVGRELRERPHDPDLLVRAAAFYEKARLFEIAGKDYERAAGSDSARRDGAVARRVAVPRGLNLLRLGKPGEAAQVLRESFESAPDGADGDVVLFGWMMAELQQGRLRDADRPYRELIARHPGSRYAARAKENMAAAAKRN